MGSYNYEALHRRTPSIKRTWSGDPIANSFQAISESYVNGYGNALQDRFLLAHTTHAQARAQAFNNGPYYDLPQYNASTYDMRFPAPIGLVPPNHLPEVAEQNIYTNRLPIQWAMSEPILVREPIIREPILRESISPEPLIREPDSLLSSPSSTPNTPDATKEPTLPGMIFGCTSETYIECMQLKLFALPATNKSEVRHII